MLITDFVDHLIEANGCRQLTIIGASEFPICGGSGILVSNELAAVRGLWIEGATFETCVDNIVLSILADRDFSGIHILNNEHRLNKGRGIVFNGTHVPIVGRPPMVEIKGNMMQTYWPAPAPTGVATLIRQLTASWDTAFFDLGGGNILVASDPTNPPAAGGEGIYITSPYIKGDAQVESIIFDLEGGATDLPTFHAEMNCRLLKIKGFYPIGTSGDAGVVIRVGRRGDNDYYWTGTSAVGAAPGDEANIDASLLLNTDIPAGQTVTCGIAGGKTGVGEVKFVLEIAKFID